MWFSLVVAATAAVAGAIPLSTPHVVHERRHQAPRRWEKGARVVPHADVPVRIGLVQSNLEGADDLLMEVSDHTSPKFSQYYSPEEIIDIFAPKKESVDAVTGWLTSSGVSLHRISLSANKQWVSLDMKVSELEALLHTEYFQFHHETTGKTSIACDEYHVPAHIQEHIDFIKPGLTLLGGGKRSSKNEKKKRGFRTKEGKFSGPVLGKKITSDLSPGSAASLTGCDTMITPACIKALYNITTPTKAAAGNELGIFEEGDFYSTEDLVEFFTTFAPNIPPTTEPILHGIDGGTAPGVVATGESNLDFSIAYPIIYPQQSVLFQTDDMFYAEGILTSSTGFLDTFLDAIDGSFCTFSAFGQTGDSPIDPVYPDPNPLGYQGKRQCGVYKPTNVISISYGEQEDDIPTAYQRRQCVEFMKLGMQGTSVILASGDSGVAARAADDNNSDGCLGANGEVFSPDFPASCPYLTAVGATYLPTGADVNKDAEVAVTSFPSGGGFSNVYHRHKYQETQLHNFFRNHDPGFPYYVLSGRTNNPSATLTHGGIYSRHGRAYPDLSAVGDNVVIFLDGAPMLIGGTSASAPVVASILNRINEERLAVGKKTVGFINPTIYAHPEVFHDITVGNNSGCGKTPAFKAGPGWDPVTGLGTPNYPALLKLYMSLP